MSKPALIVANIIGFGDNLYLTPVIKFLNLCKYEVDVLAINDEPYFKNPYVNKLQRISTGDINLNREKYKKSIFIFENLGFNSCNEHTVETFTRKVVNLSLLNKEKELIFKWSVFDEKRVRQLWRKHGIGEKDTVVTIAPVVTWPSKTLPLSYYQDLISLILGTGAKVVLVGKEIEPKKDFASVTISDKVGENEVKGLYPRRHFPGVIDLTNQLTLAELGCVYSKTDVAVNTENGNMVMSCTNDRCWNLYIPSLTAPDYRLPFRQGNQYYRTTVVANKEEYYPTHNYMLFKHLQSELRDLHKAEVMLPTVDDVFVAYRKIVKNLAI